MLVGTFFIFSGIELSTARKAELQAAGTYTAYLHSEIMRVVPTYVTLGCVVLLLAFIIGRTRFPPGGESGVISLKDLPGEISALLRIPTLRAAVIAQFCYCGAQISTWSAFIPYVKQYTAASERTAALFLTGNLLALLLGRIISTSVMRWFSAARMIGVYALANIVLIGVGILHPGVVGAGALLLSSFFMSIMFPTIFALGVEDLGPRTKLGGSLIVMAVVGGAVVPPLLGLIAKQTGSYAAGYGIVIVCYVVVAIYGFRTHRSASLTGVPMLP